MWLKYIVPIRIILLIIFVSFIVAFVASQYATVQDTVRFICISCLGLG